MESVCSPKLQSALDVDAKTPELYSIYQLHSHQKIATVHTTTGTTVTPRPGDFTASTRTIPDAGRYARPSGASNRHSPIFSPSSRDNNSAKIRRQNVCL